MRHNEKSNSKIYSKILMILFFIIYYAPIVSMVILALTKKEVLQPGMVLALLGIMSYLLIRLLLRLYFGQF